MKMNRKNERQHKERIQEFQKFLAVQEAQPPAALSKELLAKVHSDLNPRLGTVLAKLSLIHLVAGSVTLFLCPQFGIGFSAGPGLMGLFMHLGEIICMAGCGAVFLGLSGLTGSLILSAEEVIAIRRRRFLHLPILSSMSLAAFICFGTDLALTLSMVWFLGSILGGLVSLELGWQLRSFCRKIHGNLS